MVIGIKVDSIVAEGGFKGYIKLFWKGKREEITIDRLRNNKYDAFSDAVKEAKKWGIKNNVSLVVDYYML